MSNENEQQPKTKERSISKQITKLFNICISKNSIQIHQQVTLPTVSTNEQSKQIMDISRPQLLWISNRCYRVNSDNMKPNNNGGEIIKSGYIEEDLFENYDDFDEFDIISTSNGTFKTTYHIPSIFFSQIIGSKGLTKKRIEAESKAQIQVPKIGIESDIVITGRTKMAVASARSKVNLIALAARLKQQSTHFIAIPFNSGPIQKSFQTFKDEILKNCPDIENILFSQSTKLHLTIGMLTLMDNNDRVVAAEILHDCKTSVIGPILDRINKTSINVHLCGLKIMNDDPSMVDVLYGDVKSEELQLIANGIIEKFINKGLAKKRSTDVKLHVTLMKSRENSETNNELPVKRKPFDARKILETYSNFDFNWQQITEIQLCQRHSTSYDGFYEATGILKF